MVTFALDTSLLRHTSSSWQGWLRRCGAIVVWFLGTIVTLMQETALVSFRTLAFFFPLVKSTFPLSTPLKPFRLLATAPDSTLPCLASKFRSRSFWSILLFTIVFNFWYLGIISFDESPCRAIPIRFWVARTHVFTICTDFPGYHRRESLT